MTILINIKRKRKKHEKIYWLMVWNIFCFPYNKNNHPNWPTPSFFRGVVNQPPTGTFLWESRARFERFDILCAGQWLECRGPQRRWTLTGPGGVRRMICHHLMEHGWWWIMSWNLSTYIYKYYYTYIRLYIYIIYIHNICDSPGTLFGFVWTKTSDWSFCSGGPAVQGLISLQELQSAFQSAFGGGTSTLIAWL
jgi:hypothetical protein